MSSPSRLQAFLSEPRNIIVAGIREDVPAELARFRAIREKHGLAVPPDDQFAAELIADDRVLLAITPSGPPSTWRAAGLD